MRALESVTLKEPRKAELCPALTCICCLSGTAMKRGVAVLVTGPSAGAGAPHPLCPVLPLWHPSVVVSPGFREVAP